MTDPTTEALHRFRVTENDLPGAGKKDIEETA